jgi:hypothetical protein
MNSAYDGVHRFQIPAVVNGINPDAITWSASDPSMVDMQDTDDGVMITMRKAGTTNIIATAGTLCGTSLLTITQASPDDWTAGNARYNDGIVLPPGGRPGGGGGGDGGVSQRTMAACTNCHGDTATNGQFRTVAHTPQQTGGFTDSQLIDIFTKGMVPAGGYFDESIVSKTAWSAFHRWDMTAAEAKGMVVYLRALTPTPQSGKRGDFGGGFMRPDGGGRRGGDGGGGGMRRGDGGATD